MKCFFFQIQWRIRITMYQSCNCSIFCVISIFQFDHILINNNRRWLRDSGLKNRENFKTKVLTFAFLAPQFPVVLFFNRLMPGHMDWILKSVLISRSLRIRGHNHYFWIQKMIWKKKYKISYGGSGHRAQTSFFLRVTDKAKTTKK